MHDMRQRWRWGIVGILVITVASLSVLAVASNFSQTLLPIAISIVSLIISLVSAFRGQLFPFQLKVLPGGLCYVRHSAVSSDESSTDELDLVLPLSFINSGYGDGVIDGVAVKVLDKAGTAMLYLPAMEIDLKAFVQGISIPSKANLIGLYMPFPLHTRQSVHKVWLFTQDSAQNPYPKARWHPGSYRIEYFIKESLWNQPSKVATLDLDVGESQIEAAKKGVAVMIASKNITP